MRVLEEPMIYQNAEQTLLSRGASNIYVLIGCTQFSLLRKTNCKWRYWSNHSFQYLWIMVLSIFSSDAFQLYWDFHVSQIFCWKNQMISGCSSRLSLSYGVMQCAKPGSSCTWQNLAQVMFVTAEEIQALSQKIGVSFSLASMCTNIAFNAGFFAPLFHLKLNSSWPWSFQQICFSSVKRPAFVGRLFLVCGKQFALLSPAAEKDAFDGLLFI